jgi:hypothetical protein
MKDVAYYLAHPAELTALLAHCYNPIDDAMAVSILANPVFKAAMQEMIADMIASSPP